MSTITDVARLAGVSTATVSRTFREPGLIKEQTQKRVLDVARELNYQPRRSRSPKKGFRGQRAVAATASATAVGFQFFGSTSGDALFSNVFYAPVLAGAQAEAAELGLHLLVHTTDRHGLSRELPRMVAERAVDGLLVVGTAERAVIDAFACHVPDIILVDNADCTCLYEGVASDGFGGAYMATRYLIGLGHRRIGFFPSTPDVASFQDRLYGYVCAHQDAGVAPDPTLIIHGHPTSPDTEREEALTALLTSEARPTALVAANDHYALHAYRVCRAIGLSVPGALSIVGFDDIVFSGQADPPLTTVRVEKEFLGRLAVRLLHARLQSDHHSRGGEDEPAVCHRVPVSFVERQSCRPVTVS